MVRLEPQLTAACSVRSCQGLHGSATILVRCWLLPVGRSRPSTIPTLLSGERGGRVPRLRGCRCQRRLHRPPPGRARRSQERRRALRRDAHERRATRGVAAPGPLPALIHETTRIELPETARSLLLRHVAPGGFAVPRPGRSAHGNGRVRGDLTATEARQRLVGEVALRRPSRRQTACAVSSLRAAAASRARRGPCRRRHCGCDPSRAVSHHVPVPHGRRALLPGACHRGAREERRVEEAEGRPRRASLGTSARVDRPLAHGEPSLAAQEINSNLQLPISNSQLPSPVRVNAGLGVGNWELKT